MAVQRSSRRKQLQCVGAALCLLLGTALARAQPVTGPTDAAESSSSDHDARVVLLAPSLDSHSVGVLVRSLAQLGVAARGVIEAGFDPTLEACGTFACLTQLASAGDGRAALVDIAPRPGGERSLLLVLVEADGRSAQARARVPQGGLERAFLGAWKEATLMLTLAGQSMIEAESRPSGASVWLDGAYVGATPWAHRVMPGTHRLRLELDGFVSQERVVEAQAGRLQRVEVLLKRGPRFDGGRIAGPPTRPASAWNSVVGGALAVIAVPALILSVNALATDGQCLETRPAGGCSDRARFGTRSAYVFTFGVVALATGGTLLLVRPL